MENPITPTSMTYSIIDSLTHTTIVGPTTIVPVDKTYNIIVTPVQNAFTTSTNHIERKIITGTYTYNGNTGTFEIDYTLTDMTVTVQDVMDNLQNDLWILDSENPDDYVITEDEVETFIIKAMRRVAGFYNLSGPNSLPVGVDSIDEAVSTWAAGLIMNKYEDGEGDSKVDDAESICLNYTIPIHDPDPEPEQSNGSFGLLI